MSPDSTQKAAPDAPGDADTSAPPPNSARAKRGLGSARAAVFERYGLIIIFVVVAIFFSILRPSTFAQYPNFRSLAIAYSVLAIAALALIVPLVAARSWRLRRCRPSTCRCRSPCSRASRPDASSAS
jgi:hypothetical protein